MSIYFIILFVKKKRLGGLRLTLAVFLKVIEQLRSGAETCLALSGDLVNFDHRSASISV